MSIKSTCPICKGNQIVDYLINLHDDETSKGICHNCKGKGYINRITNSEEDDYWGNH